MSVYFRILNHETTGELTYLLADLAAQEAVLIDPHGRDWQLLLALLAEHELRLRWVLRTHHHDTLQPEERGLLEGLDAPLIQGDALAALHLHDGAELPFGHEWVRLLVTPGHTQGCLSFCWRDRLFCGGLLTLSPCQYQPYPALPEALWDSVTRRIFTLPDETLLFSAHEQQARAVSTVLEQRRWHPLFANLTRDEFLAQMTAMPQSNQRTSQF